MGDFVPGMLRTLGDAWRAMQLLDPTSWVVHVRQLRGPSRSAVTCCKRRVAADCRAEGTVTMGAGAVLYLYAINTVANTWRHLVNDTVRYPWRERHGRRPVVGTWPIWDAGRQCCARRSHCFGPSSRCPLLPAAVVCCQLSVVGLCCTVTVPHATSAGTDGAEMLEPWGAETRTVQSVL